MLLVEDLTEDVVKVVAAEGAVGVGAQHLVQVAGDLRGGSEAVVVAKAARLPAGVICSLCRECDATTATQPL